MHDTCLLYFDSPLKFILSYIAYSICPDTLKQLLIVLCLLPFLSSFDSELLYPISRDSRARHFIYVPLNIEDINVFVTGDGNDVRKLWSLSFCVR